jgi:hypothetical protein
MQIKYSTHLLPKQALGPALKGTKASLFQSDFINLSGLKVRGSSQYLATFNPGVNLKDCGKTVRVLTIVV